MSFFFGGGGGGMVEAVCSKVRSDGFDGGVKCGAKVLVVVFNGFSATIRGMTTVEYEMRCGGSL